MCWLRQPAELALTAVLTLKPARTLGGHDRSLPPPRPTACAEAVGKQSKAAMSLCMWARAMDVYHR